MNEKKELNNDERSEAIIDIAEKFKQCDTYEKGFVAGFIEAAKAIKGGNNDANASMPSTQIGI